MIVLLDPYEKRGGGQAVLEELLRQIPQAVSRVVLSMPARGRNCIEVPAHVSQCEIGAVTRVVAGSDGVVLVSNSNVSHIPVLRIAKAVRRMGIRCKTVAILHNYPATRLRRTVLKAALRHFDHAIAVEPGLAILSGKAQIPSWLSAAPRIAEPIELGSFDRRVIKSFARPDPSKGMHLLPDIFRAMDRQGFTCEVALGDPLESHPGYVDKLKADLAPWLVEGRRSPEWLEPGDIFIVPSIYGEAACLSAQEAMSRGVFVVASRVGLMPYLSPTNEGIRTFASGDPLSAISALGEVGSMPTYAFREECLAGAEEMLRRNARWYTEVSSMLVNWDIEVSTTPEPAAIKAECGPS